MSEPRRGIYRHHGGGLYVVLGVGRNSTNGPQDGERMVFYLSLSHLTIHVRELDQFNEPVVWPDSVIRCRFDSVL